jgi:hypothetical protein
MKTRKLVFAAVVALGAASAVQATTFNLGKIDGESGYLSDGAGSKSSFADYVKIRLAGRIPSTAPSFAELAAGNSRGEIVGITGRQSGSWGARLPVAAVKEADVWMMLMIGLGLVGYQLRRKQQGLKQLPFAV